MSALYSTRSTLQSGFVQSGFVRGGFCAVALALALVGCGDATTEPDTSSTVQVDTSTTESKAVSHNDADTRFAQQMIPHHAQAVALSTLAFRPTTEASNEVKTLATAIQGAQKPEIEQMTALLKSWGEPVEMDMSDGHDMSMHAGMVSDTDVGMLAKLKGHEFDVRWATLMREHHKGAVMSATNLLDEGSNPELAAIASAIVASQNEEIKTLNVLAGDK